MSFKALLFLILACSLASVSGLQLSPISGLRLSSQLAKAQTTWPRVSSRVRAQVPPEDENEEQRRARLEELGRQAAEEQAALDTGADDGGLMAE